MRVVRSADHPAAVRAHPLPTLQCLIDREAGSDAMTILKNELIADQEVPEHTHDVEEVLIVTSGGCRVEVAGETADLDAGDAVVVPPNTAHSFRHLGARPTTVIAVLASADVKINTPT